MWKRFANRADLEDFKGSGSVCDVEPSNLLLAGGVGNSMAMEKVIDAAESDAPRERDLREPRRLPEKARIAGADLPERVVQAAEDANGEETGDHRDDVAGIVAAGFREHAREKHPEQRTVRVAEDAEHDRDNAEIEDAVWRKR